ncbi:hypothetical protein RIF29_09704 [Crotalaria pallida]|uniref:Uncharacterized protein n=1 Tax=Crotalaria pallida TaxID=3830 RepID=A0AAN9FS31_CROPI
MSAYVRTHANDDESKFSPALAQEPHAPWHSPVPYLFSGLAAMLGLIAFAILIRLACSFCKLLGFLQGNQEEEARRDLEAQNTPPPPYIHDEKFFEVMAGEERPTFLAISMWLCRVLFHPRLLDIEPETLPDGTINLMIWHCTIPGKAGNLRLSSSQRTRTSQDLIM